MTYENTNEEIIAVKRKPRHQPPHLHNAMEIVCVTKGTLELGVGQELYHMETGDIGVVFPDVIHHYQVFSYVKCTQIISPILYDNYLIPFSLLSFSFAASTFIFERRIVIRISNTNGNHKYIT